MWPTYDWLAATPALLVILVAGWIIDDFAFLTRSYFIIRVSYIVSTLSTLFNSDTCKWLDNWRFCISDKVLLVTLHCSDRKHISGLNSGLRSYRFSKLRFYQFQSIYELWNFAIIRIPIQNLGWDSGQTKLNQIIQFSRIHPAHLWPFICCISLTFLHCAFSHACHVAFVWLFWVRFLAKQSWAKSSNWSNSAEFIRSTSGHLFHSVQSKSIQFAEFSFFTEFTKFVS